MSKSLNRRNNGPRPVFHAWAKRWRNSRGCRCSFCRGGRQGRPRPRKAQRDAAIQEQS